MDAQNIKHYTRAVRKALQRHGINVPYAALRASLLEARGLNPHAHKAGVGRSPAWRPVPFDARGWTVLDRVYCAGFNVVVYSRPDAAGAPGWRYAVCVDSGLGESALNRGRWLARVPHRAVLESLLLEDGLLVAVAPGLPHEWAITVNGVNRFPSNFLSETLARRAVDELFLCARSTLSDEDRLCLFTIAPDGTQDEDAREYWTSHEWCAQRWPALRTEFE